MSEERPKQRFRPRAPRRYGRRPVLVREVGTLRCWAAQLIDWSLTGARLAGFPQRGSLSVGTAVEILEGLDSESFEELTPSLSQPDPAKLDETVQRLRRQLGLRGSTGTVARVEEKIRHFAIRFDQVSDEGRTYPIAHSRNPPLRVTFTYRNSVGVFAVKGDLTPGAAIDLAKDVVRDTRQCLVVVDFSATRRLNRIALEKFRTRLHSELTPQDVAYALAVVSPEEWVRETLDEIKTYPSLQQAEEAVRAGLTVATDLSFEETPNAAAPCELLEDLDDPANSDETPE